VDRESIYFKPMYMTIYIYIYICMQSNLTSELYVNNNNNNDDDNNNIYKLEEEKMIFSSYLFIHICFILVDLICFE
jgi:uncharacterized membrane protein